MDASNSVFGIRRTANDLKYIDSLVFPGDICTNSTKNFYLIPMSTDPVSDFRNGSFGGAYLATGNELIRVYWPATSAVGSYQITVLGFASNDVTMKNGMVIASK